MSEARARVCGASVCVRTCVFFPLVLCVGFLSRAVCVCMIYFVLFAALTRAVHTYVFSFVLFAALARAVVLYVLFPFLCVCVCARCV